MVSTPPCPSPECSAPWRTPSLAALLATSSAALAAEGAPVPQPKPAGPLTVAVPGMPEIPPVGPRGTLGADVYRRRRQALMEKFKTGAAW